MVHNFREKMSIAVVTDSTADIPQGLAEKHSISIIPAILVMDGDSFKDGTGITRREFYEQLPNMVTSPTTATPSIGTFQDIYEKLFQKGYESIISIHVSSLLSGIYGTAKLAAKSFNKQITVIDSGQLSLGIGYQVLAASEAITKGYSLSRVISEIESIQQRIRVIAMLDTLEYVRRSGRISWAQARIGSVFKIKPFLEVKEGKVLSRGQARTRKKGIEYLLEMLKRIGEVDKLAILHTNAEADAYKIIEKINLPLAEPPLLINVTTIVGTHVGPNGLGFTAVIS
jgi:DegV family protein with EDD domain